jgi:aspartyl protease family protein
MRIQPLLCLLTALLLSSPGQADVEVKALFSGAAMIVVDGEQKLLKPGQEFKGVVLIEATSQQAIAEINGKRQTLLLSTRITTSYVELAAAIVHIRKNQHRQYITTALINGHSARVLIDTGANIVAINAGAARAMGLKYKDGIPSRVQTAAGVVPAYQVKLEKVDVGGLVVHHVEASIIEGSHPAMVLLGTSYLQHVEMSEKDGVLMLKGKF